MVGLWLCLFNVGKVDTAKVLQPTVVAASLFKNGFSLVTREVQIDAAGEYAIDEIPRATLGTYWVITQNSIQLDWLKNASSTKTSTTPATSFEQLLSLNVGKTLVLTLSGIKGPVNLEGKVVSADGNLLVMEAEGKVQIFPKSSVVYVEAKPGTVLVQPVTTEGRQIQFHIKGTSGKMRIISLEYGMGWQPSYMVDISDPKSLSLTSKATLTNEITDIDGKNLRLVTGFPDLQYLGQIDPISYIVGAVAYPSNSYANGAKDYGQMQNAPAMRQEMDNFTPTAISAGNGEDLFFYDLPAVNIKKGQRSYHIVFQDKHPFQHVHTCDLPDELTLNNGYAQGSQPRAAIEVWHSIRFENTTAHPLSSAPAMVMKDGDLIGQSPLNYTSPGGEALIRIAKALDVQVETAENEESRTRLPKQIQYRNFDEVRIKGTIQITNRKLEAVTLTIHKDLTGTVEEVDHEGKTTSQTRLSDVNPKAKVRWEVKVAPGETIKLVYFYKVLVGV